MQGKMKEENANKGKQGLHLQCSLPHALPQTLWKQMMTWARGHSQGAKGPVCHAEAESDSVFPELPAREGWRLVQRP